MEGFMFICKCGAQMPLKLDVRDVGDILEWLGKQGVVGIKPVTDKFCCYVCADKDMELKARVEVEAQQHKKTLSIKAKIEWDQFVAERQKLFKR